MADEASSMWVPDVAKYLTKVLVSQPSFVPVFQDMLLNISRKKTMLFIPLNMLSQEEGTRIFSSFVVLTDLTFQFSSIQSLSHVQLFATP